MKFIICLAVTAILVCGTVNSNDIPAKLAGNIDVYDVYSSDVRLVIPANKDDYVKDNYLVLVQNRNTSVLTQIHDVHFIQALQSLVMYVSGLNPVTTYKFRVVDKSKGIFFESTDVTTVEPLDKPDKAEENTFYISFEDTHAIVMLKEHINWVQCGLWYEIYLIDPSNNNSVIQKEEILCTMNSKYFRNLKKGKTYKFKIVICNGYKCSDPMVTKEYVSGSSNRAIEVLNVTDTSCTIQWEKLTNNYNDEGYIIHVVDQGIRNFGPRSLNSTLSNKPITIDNLHPGNIYAISVSAQNSEMSPFVEVECNTLPVKAAPSTPHRNSFMISFEDGIAQVVLKDSSLHGNCAQRFNIYVFKKTDHRFIVAEGHIECFNYEAGPFYLDPGTYYVTIRACNREGCSEELVSREYEIVESKVAEPIDYKVVDTTDSSCTILWVEQSNLSEMSNRTIRIPEVSPEKYYEINFIVIGTDSHDPNFHTAKNACNAHHSQITPAKPAEDVFDISIKNKIATIKWHDNTNKNCEGWYSVRLWVPSLFNGRRRQVYLNCKDEFANIEDDFTNNNYNFEIMACNGNGCSEAITRKIYTTNK
ncbi:uncharacterized protein LOC122512298 [Leptopilina heterotoma]|uniref:uncharacterized protein LOC122512298 n=1 Tax=Leptopilina heterotoma TaxID=63436 RepID=UPI001CA9A40F|nr:uncharacterized protein LOC122512298 [Leptopilina heterotoma]